MMKIVKRAAMLAVAIIATVTVSAQSLPMSLGVSGVYSTGDGLNNFGVQAKYRIGITGGLRAEGGFTYFPEQDWVSMWDASINLQYVFQLADNVAIYPLAGVSMMGHSEEWYDYYYGDYSYSDSELGFNIGAGMDFDLNENLGLNAEFKYRLGDMYDRPIISLGLFYKF